MRIPKITRSKYHPDVAQKHTISLSLEPVYYYSDIIAEDDVKGYDRMIKSIERMVRNSYEYKNYISYLKQEIDMNHCSFFTQLSREDVSIEIHHCPFTLYDLTSIVYNKHVMEEGADNYNIYKIAEEVTKLHYEGKVGLIPLSVTVHELVHRGDVFIPLDSVYGDVAQFYQDYTAYITKEQKELLKSHIMLTKQINKQSYQPSVLERKYTYVQIDGYELPHKVTAPATAQPPSSSRPKFSRSSATHRTAAPCKATG